MICSRLTSKFDLSKQVPLSRSFHPIIGDPSRIPNGQLMIAKIYKVTVTSNEYSSVLSTWAQIFFRENNVLYSPHSFGLDLKKLGERNTLGRPMVAVPGESG